MAHFRDYQTFGGWPGKIDCPRSMPESEGGFKTFRLADLFVASNGDTDIHASHINGLGVPVVSSGSKNNGIIGLSDINAQVFAPGTITIDMFGNCYYQWNRYKMVTHARVFSLSPLGFLLNEKRGLFLVAQLSFINKLFSYGNMANWAKIKEYNLSLPVLKNGDINWLYIETFVEGIVKSREKELTKFLKSNGYSDCSLTVEELHSLELFASNNVQMEEKAIKESFSIEKGKRLTKSNMIPGNTNFIGASATENGITNRISNNKYVHSGNLITVTYNGSVGESFYQPFPFWASDDVNVLYPIEKLSESQCLYFLAPLRKKGNKYGYTFKWTKEIMEQDSICVPVKSDGSIDYDLMETYINALKKLCIARLKTSNIFTHDIFETMQIEKKGEEANNNLVHNTTTVPDTDRFTRYLPLYSVKAACGPHEHNFSDEGLDNDLGWIDVSKFGHRLNENMFVVQAVGHSMEPNINDGDYCVFERYSPNNAGSREGKIVLAKDITGFDDDYSGSFTIKQYHRVSDGKVELRSINDGHPTFTLESNEEYENNNPILAVFIGKL